ncbi:hypothetical protein CEXT_180711 [Caerostris extrusa]|uniref:Secreted protein n=1 Tax=Caerostris extrusa TaxID=172846 RepID=A0AAV4Y5G5_CAEEX|nr:hypothetical protein CEXT_180711 [Caerostris extrusa]
MMHASMRELNLHCLSVISSTLTATATAEEYREEKRPKRYPRPNNNRGTFYPAIYHPEFTQRAMDERRGIHFNCDCSGRRIQRRREETEERSRPNNNRATIYSFITQSLPSEQWIKKSYRLRNCLLSGAKGTPGQYRPGQ